MLIEIVRCIYQQSVIYTRVLGVMCVMCVATAVGFVKNHDLVSLTHIERVINAPQVSRTKLILSDLGSSDYNYLFLIFEQEASGNRGT